MGVENAVSCSRAPSKQSVLLIFTALHPGLLPVRVAKQARLLLAIPQGRVQGVQVSLEPMAANDLRHCVGVEEPASGCRRWTCDDDDDDEVSVIAVV